MVNCRETISLSRLLNMSSLSISQRSFSFSFGDGATLNETQGSLSAQMKAHSSKQLQKKSLRVILGDAESCELQNFRLKSPNRFKP